MKWKDNLVKHKQRCLETHDSAILSSTFLRESHLVICFSCFDAIHTSDFIVFSFYFFSGIFISRHGFKNKLSKSKFRSSCEGIRMLNKCQGVTTKGKNRKTQEYTEGLLAPLLYQSMSWRNNNKEGLQHKCFPLR